MQRRTRQVRASALPSLEWSRVCSSAGFSVILSAALRQKSLSARYRCRESKGTMRSVRIGLPSINFSLTDSEAEIVETAADVIRVAKENRIPEKVRDLTRALVDTHRQSRNRRR
jgi:hypothetical protein